MEDGIMMAESSMSILEQAPDTLLVSPPTVRASRSPAWFASCLLPALATGGLLWLCHFPIAWGWLGWLALVPLLCLVRSEAPARRVYFSAWFSGLVFFWPAIQWMRVADDRMYYTWGALSTYCSFFFPIGIYFLRRLDRTTRLPLTVTLPIVWTALEFFRGCVFTGFAWYFLGYTQHRFLPLIQVSDLAGVYAVTFLVAAVNALLFELLFTRVGFRRLFALPEIVAAKGRAGLGVQAIGTMLLLGGSLAYGCLRLAQQDDVPGPRVALVQGNLDQRIRNEPTAADQVIHHYKTLSEQAATQQPRPDLIVWPETSYPSEWAELADDFPVESVYSSWREPESEHQELTASDAAYLRNHWRLRKNADLLADVRGARTNLLLGLNSIVYDTPKRWHRFNSALLIRANGEMGERYDKMHRVPFGEYIPLRDVLPFMERLAPYDFDYSIRSGEHFTRFPIQTAGGVYRFGVVICFEDGDADLARQYGKTDRDGPPVDFLVDISNDGWFNGTSEHEERLAMCRFRTIECRRSMARAVNMGISAVIDGSGRVIHLPGPTWAESKKIEAVLTAVIPIDRRTSLYARWGDWMPWGCWLFMGIALLRPILRRQRQPLSA